MEGKWLNNYELKHLAPTFVGLTPLMLVAACSLSLFCCRPAYLLHVRHYDSRLILNFRLPHNVISRLLYTYSVRI